MVVLSPSLELAPYTSQHKAGAAIVQTTLKNATGESGENGIINVMLPDEFDPRTWEFADRCPQGAPLVNLSGVPVSAGSIHRDTC